jgi:uncharacterized membrane protein YdfJ with MMPL/SSD domain
VRSLASLVSGRRTKWLVPLVWIALLAVFAPIGSKLTDESAEPAPAGTGV